MTVSVQITNNQTVSKPNRNASYSCTLYSAQVNLEKD